MHVVLASHWYSSELEQIKTIIRCRSSYEKHTTYKTGVSSLKSKNWKPFLKHDFSSRQHISGLHRREKVSLLLPPPLAHSLQGYWLANFGVACLERTSVSVDFLPAKIHLFRHHNINADLLFTIRKHSHLLIKDNERWISTFCLTQSWNHGRCKFWNWTTPSDKNYFKLNPWIVIYFISKSHLWGIMSICHL